MLAFEEKMKHHCTSHYATGCLPRPVPVLFTNYSEAEEAHQTGAIVSMPLHCVSVVSLCL